MMPGETSPTLVQTVNDWIIIQEKRDPTASLNRTWAEFEIY